MPFPNEHAARQKDPGKYTSFRRGKWPWGSRGVSIIWGIKGGKTEIQPLRFSSSKFAPEAAKRWLKERDFKTILESATEKTTKGFWNIL